LKKIDFTYKNANYVVILSMAHFTTVIYGENKNFRFNIVGNLTLNIINRILLEQDEMPIERNELKQLKIGINVKSIGYGAFDYCSNLTGNLIIPHSVVKIGNFAFNNCRNLTGNLIIPNSVTEIGSKAFYFCDGLTGKLTIPDSVVKIKYAAFGYCTGLHGDIEVNTTANIDFKKVFIGCDLEIISENDADQLDEEEQSENDTDQSDDDSSYVPDYDELSESDANDIPEENKLQRRSTRSRSTSRSSSETDDTPEENELQCKSAYYNFINIKNKVLENKYPNITERISEFERLWRNLSQTERNKYKRVTKPLAINETSNDTDEPEPATNDDDETSNTDVSEHVPEQKKIPVPTRYKNFCTIKKETLKKAVPDMYEREGEIRRMWTKLTKKEKNKYKTENNPFAVKEKIVEKNEFVPSPYGNFYNIKKNILKKTIPNMKERVEIKRMWQRLSKTEKDKYKPASNDTDDSDDEPEQATTNGTDDSDDEPEQATTNDTDVSESSDNSDYSDESSDDDETCYNNTVSNVRINIKKSKHISIVFN
jgi:hypothetical protein